MAKGPTLGYWDMRGVAEPIRMLLRYKKIEFVDKRYTYGTDTWANDKPGLGLDFPNLPYFLDGDVKLTQSTAIIRYLAEKYGLDGKTQEERVRVSLVEQQLNDFCWSAYRLCYADNYEVAKVEFDKTVPAQLKQFEAFLGDRKFLAGPNLTYVDFMAYEIFDFYKYFIPGICQGFPKLRAFQDRFKSLPPLKDYFNSPTYKLFPFLRPISKFGGQNEPPKCT